MNNLALSPDKLRNHITFEIAQACKCEGAWVQHPHPLTEQEISDVRARINSLLDSLAPVEVAA